MALAFRVWHTPHAAAQQELTKLLRQLEFSLAYWIQLAVEIQQKPLAQTLWGSSCRTWWTPAWWEAPLSLWHHGCCEQAQFSTGLGAQCSILVMWTQQQEGSTQWHWQLPIPKTSRDTNQYPRVSESWCMQTCQGEWNQFRALCADLSTVWRAWTSKAAHKFHSHVNTQGLLLIAQHSYFATCWS